MLYSSWRSMSIWTMMMMIMMMEGIIMRRVESLSPSDYLITSLPLLESSINFNQYAGYMNLGDADETALFFWFVESQNDPATDPVVLWLNGGPGSSSVAYGFWTEHGPFRLAPNAVAVDIYDWPWNSIANVIYLESPSGVGFSYSNKTSGYNCSDTKTAHINYLFLLRFFEVFTQFQSNDFYVTGESYGGHYVPQLSQMILEQNNTINMQGFLVGNPGTQSDWYYNLDEYAFQTFLWSHALLPQTAWLKSYNSCGWDKFYTACADDFTNRTLECEAANDEAYRYVPSTWDPYNIYAPTCHNSSLLSEDSPHPNLYGEEFIYQYTPFLRYLKEKYQVETTYVYNPCLNQWTPEYMNRKDVLDAIHASSHYTRPWPSHPIGWSYGSELADINLIYPEFFQKAPEWKISIISGDADAAVPFMGTQRWIECLGQPVVRDWTNWWMNEDVAGSYKIFEGITFLTVKGCGHTIPTYCPEQGFLFFEQYINGTYSSQTKMD